MEPKTATTTGVRDGALLTVSQLALLLGVSRWTIYRLVRAGELPTVRVGERKRFRPADVDRYLERGAQK